MQTNFVEFKTPDGLLLPGMLFEPKRKTKKVLIFLHGNGSSGAFYGYTRTCAMAQALNASQIAYFAFNNRGAHVVHRLKKVAGNKKINSGTAYELIRDCIKDIDGALAFLKNQGFNEFYLCGFSTGANKICTYHYLKKENPAAKYILLSGGDDCGIYYQMFGKRKFWEVLKQCRQKIRHRKGQELVSKDILNFPYSYQGLYDILNPEGFYNSFPFYDALHHLKLSRKPLFREYRTINKPTLVMCGSQDEYCSGRAGECLELMKTYCRRPDMFDFVLTKGADHGYFKKEKIMAKTIADWLCKD